MLKKRKLEEPSYEAGRMKYEVDITSAGKLSTQRRWEGWFYSAAQACYEVLREDEKAGADHGATVGVTCVRLPGTCQRTPGSYVKRIS